MLTASLSPIDAAAHTWDVIVIGAGPAGAMAACEAAEAGAETILLDRRPFPRSKVCGCCINAAALDLLARAGLGDLTLTAGAQRLDVLQLRCQGHRADLPLTGSAALSRRCLDARLVRRAIAAGAAFLPRASVRCSRIAGPHRVVDAHHPDGQVALQSRVVIAANGLAGPSLHDDDDARPLRSSARTRSYIGVQSMMIDQGASIPEAVVVMNCGRRGYVGLVRVETQQIDIAAAIDPRFIQECGGAGAAVAALLAEAGTELPRTLPHLQWKGTPRLTRTPRTSAGERLLLAGDAVGYVEPFTGEGIAWALATGRAAGRVAARAAAQQTWTTRIEREWREDCRAMLASRHARCLALTRLLRRPILARLAIEVLRRSPRLASPLVHRITHGPL